jgi:hypothetical protein
MIALARTNEMRQLLLAESGVRVAGARSSTHAENDAILDHVTHVYAGLYARHGRRQTTGKTAKISGATGQTAESFVHGIWVDVQPENGIPFQVETSAE